MGQNIGTGGRVWGKILGQCVLYKGVLAFLEMPIRPFSRPEFRDNVPNSGHLAKMSLFCPEFRVFWTKNRDISDFHTFLYHFSLFGLYLSRFCPDFTNFHTLIRS